MVDELADIEEPVLLEEEEPEDTAIEMTTALVMTTTVLLLVAHFMAQKALGNLFDIGLLS